MLSFIKPVVLSFILTLLINVKTEAKTFQNSYVSFEIPDHWNCQLQETEWVCRSQIGEQAREAIVILTAKEVGPEDGLAQYQNYLKGPKTITTRAGKPIQSQVLSTQIRKITDHDWVDSMHLSSEVNNYYTRYLATVKDKIAILVTYSAHRTHFTRYSSEFLKSVMSLKVTALPEGQNKIATPIRPSTETIGAPIESQMQDLVDVEEIPSEEQNQNSSSRSIAIFLALICLLAGAILYFKNRRANK